jgi:hypothetical protein
MTRCTREKSYTSDELKALIARGFPDRNIETQYKRAVAKDSNMMKWDKAVKRWVWAFDPEPKFKDLELSTDDGSKYAERLRLYGLMPRLKHKPGDKYVAAESEVLKFMSQQSGVTDFSELSAEYNRIPRAWIDSDKDERDSDSKIARANLIHDRATGETMGLLTYREELKSKAEDVCDDVATAGVVKKAEQSATDWQGDYLQYRLNEDTDEYEFRIGKHEVSESIWRRIKRMPKQSRKEAGKWLQKFFSFRLDTHKLIDRLIEEEDFNEWREGDVSGMTGDWEREIEEAERIAEEKAEKERKDQEKKVEEEKRKAEQDRRKAEKLSYLKTEAEKLKSLPKCFSERDVEKYIIRNRIGLKFEWNEVAQYATDNGLIIYSHGTFIGANPQ